MIPWTQMDAGWTSHPKMQELAFCISGNAGGSADAQIVAVGLVASLWDYAARWCPDGDITEKQHLLPMLWRKTPPVTDTILGYMVEVGLLDETDERLRIHGWDERYSDLIERQNEKKRKAAERKRRQRNKKGQPKGGGDVPPMSRDVTPCPTVVTSSPADVTLVTVLDRDVDRDGDIETTTNTQDDDLTRRIGTLQKYLGPHLNQNRKRPTNWPKLVEACTGFDERGVNVLVELEKMDAWLADSETAAAKRYRKQGGIKSPLPFLVNWLSNAKPAPLIDPADIHPATWNMYEGRVNGS